MGQSDKRITHRAHRLLMVWAIVRGAWGALVRRKAIRSLHDGRVLALAYGDGVHDDARHIQFAVDQGGGAFPPGTFATRGPLTLRHDTVIHGSSVSPTTLQMDQVLWEGDDELPWIFPAGSDAKGRTEDA